MLKPYLAQKNQIQKKSTRKHSLLERTTRLELATNCLEGSDSSQLSYIRVACILCDQLLGKTLESSQLSYIRIS